MLAGIEEAGIYDTFYGIAQEMPEMEMKHMIEGPVEITDDIKDELILLDDLIETTEEEANVEWSNYDSQMLEYHNQMRTNPQGFIPHV